MCTNAEEVSLLQHRRGDSGDAIIDTVACHRRSSARYLPEDLRSCSTPVANLEPFNNIAWQTVLSSNPMEPGCWEEDNPCAPYKCSETCTPFQESRMQLWEPIKPDKQKVLVFQYGKVASSALVEGLKTQEHIAAAHAHSTEEAQRWMTGQATVARAVLRTLVLHLPKQ